MKTRFLLSILATLVCGAALGGAVRPQPVQIDFVARSAQGDMYSARTSDNNNEYIGCGVRAATGVLQAFCQAGLKDPDQNPTEVINCFTLDPTMIEAIHSIGDFSFITFRWNEDFECTFVGTSTQSFYLPDFKAKK
jgi:hypothetical protein